MNEIQVIALENTDISTWDFPTIKSELQKYLSEYERLVYTDDSIKDAKKDKAALNKAKKVVEDARKVFKTKCLEPYEKLEPQIRELVDMIEKQKILIDDTVKDYEQRQKEAKELAVRDYYNQKAIVIGDMAEALYPKLFDKKWVNATTSRTKYEEGVQEAINEALENITLIREMDSPFVDSLLEVYAKTVSMDQVKAKKAELEEAARKASLTTADEAAAAGIQTAARPIDEALVNTEAGIVLKIYATQAQMDQVTDFMKTIGVRYEII